MYLNVMRCVQYEYEYHICSRTAIYHPVPHHSMRLSSEHTKASIISYTLNKICIYNSRTNVLQFHRIEKIKKTKLEHWTCVMMLSILNPENYACHDIDVKQWFIIRKIQLNIRKQTKRFNKKFSSNCSIRLIGHINCIWYHNNEGGKYVGRCFRIQPECQIASRSKYLKNLIPMIDFYFAYTFFFTGVINLPLPDLRLRFHSDFSFFLERNKKLFVN